MIYENDNVIAHAIDNWYDPGYYLQFLTLCLTSQKIKWESVGKLGGETLKNIAASLVEDETLTLMGRRTIGELTSVSFAMWSFNTKIWWMDISISVQAIAVAVRRYLVTVGGRGWYSMNVWTLSVVCCWVFVQETNVDCWWRLILRFHECVWSAVEC